MFMFGAITEITPAGSPRLQRHDYVALLDYGTYELFGQDYETLRTLQLWAETGVYVLDFGGTHIAQSFYLNPESGIYEIRVGDADLYQSSYFYGDPEMIRIPAEVTSMHIEAEPRTMTLKGKTTPILADEKDMTAPPRLRRT